MAAKMSTNGETLKFRAAKLKGFTVHGYNTRNKNKLDLNRTETKKPENSLLTVVPRIVNKTTPLIIDEIPSHSLQGYNPT